MIEAVKELLFKMIVLKQNSKEKSDYDCLLSSYDLFITFIISVTAVGF